MPGRSGLKVPLAQQVEWLRRVDPGIHGVGLVTSDERFADTRLTAWHDVLR